MGIQVLTSLAGEKNAFPTPVVFPHDFLQHSLKTRPLMHVHDQDDSGSRIASSAAGKEPVATSKQGEFFD